MATWAALLRGVNVGGHNEVSMKPLAAALEEAGAERVRTYLQSGNVVLDHAGTEAAVADLVRRCVHQVAGVDVLVVVRTAEEARPAVLAPPPAGHGSELEDRPGPARPLRALRDTCAGAQVGRPATEADHVVGGDVREQLDDLARRLLDVLGRMTGLESTYLTRIHWDADRQEVLVARNVGDIEVPEGLVVPWGDTLCRRALDQGVWATSDVPTTFPGSGAAAALGLRTYVTVPVHDDRGDVFGTLCGASGRSVELGDDVRQLLGVLAEMVTLHLRQQTSLDRLAEANAELDRLATTDVLTGLANRRHLDDELERRAAHAQRSGELVGVALFDLDGFKSINDEHGHEAGDRALRLAADALRAAARREDLVGRWGGDELLVLLHGRDPDGPARYAERALERLAATPLGTPAGPVEVRASVGTATDDGHAPLEALRRADEAMYEAKQARKAAR